MKPQPGRPKPPAQLSVGTHLTPEDGACLMEWVSVLAEEPWSDAPATTQPLLGHLGRLVNDAMTPVGRQALMPLAPRLTALDSKDPAASAELAELVTGYALGVRPSLRLEWMHRAAQRQRASAPVHVEGVPRGGVVSRVRRRIYAHGPAHRAVETAVIVLARTPDPDRHLLRLLEAAVSHVEAGSQSSRGAGRPSATEGADGPVLSSARRKPSGRAR